MELDYHIKRIYSKANPSYQVQKDVCIKLSNMELAVGGPDGPARRITKLFQDLRYGDCATLIRQLSDATITAILSDIPISAFHASLPQSLVILEVIYAKVYNCNFKVFPIDLLCSDQFLEVLVAFFSRQHENSNRAAKNCNSYFPFCRNILSVIMVVKPEVRRNLKQKKRKLDNCVLHLGHHGMVEASNGRCLHIQDALKLESQIVISRCKALIQKIEEFGATNKQTSVKGGASGASSVGHQRLLQMTKTEVQDRIIRNKTAFHLAEPAYNNSYLRQVINLLEKRMNYDKQALFHYNELRKLGSECRDDGCVSAILRQFSQGYATVLQLMSDISVENPEVGASESDSDEEVPVVPISNAHRNMSLSLNGLSLRRGGSTVPDLHSRPGASSTIDRRIPSNSVSALRKLEQPVSTKHHARVGISNNSATVMSISQPTINGHAPGPRPTDDMRSALTNGTTSNMKASVDVGSGLSDCSVRTDLQRELHSLRVELETAKNTIQMLHHREAQLRERLSEQAQKHFMVSNHHFENLSLGETRPTELIRRYGNLYTDGRIDALDALDNLPELNELNDLKGKLLFSAIVLAFRSAQNSCKEMKTKVMRLLQLPNPEETCQVIDSVSMEMRAKLDEYFQKTVHRYDISACLEEVGSQIYSTLFDYPSLRACRPLQSYLQECVRVAWSLSAQSPPYTILYDSQIFDSATHARFHSSDPEIRQIKAFLWPALLEGNNGPCVQRGVVLT